jgi:hypothetical protein
VVGAFSLLLGVFTLLRVHVTYPESNSEKLSAFRTPDVVVSPSSKSCLAVASFSYPVKGTTKLSWLWFSEFGCMVNVKDTNLLVLSLKLMNLKCRNIFFSLKGNQTVIIL